MNAKRFEFSGSTADGDQIFDDMRYTHERGYVSILFFSEAELTTVVTPSAGTVTFTISENNDAFGTISDGVVTANTVGPAVQYTRPNWSGSARAIKATFLGVLGAPFFRCIVSRYGD